MRRIRKAPEQIICQTFIRPICHCMAIGKDRFFHGYYDCYCYLPLYIFCGEQVLCARLRQANHDAAAGAVEEVSCIVAQLRQQWPQTRIVLRADSGFCREELMGWCEANKVDYLFGLARNKRLQKIIGAQMQQARVLHQKTGKPARVFTGFTYTTHHSWSRSRRVVAKAEYLDKGDNPRFVVTSLTPEQWPDQPLYEKFYCARGEMENRIKEQMCLFADRLSTDQMKGNQLRLYFSALAYTLMEALRRLGLAGTEWAQAQVNTIRLKLFKIGAIVRISVRRIKLELNSAYPWKEPFRTSLPRLALLKPLPTCFQKRRSLPPPGTKATHTPSCSTPRSWISSNMWTSTMAAACPPTRETWVPIGKMALAPMPTMLRRIGKIRARRCRQK